MKAGQQCTFRINRVGRKYGELKVMADIGNRVYRYIYGLITIPVLQLGCRKGHTEQRNAVSLRMTGDKTRCKECYRLERKKRSHRLNILRNKG